MPLDSLRRIVIESDTRRGRIFDLVIQVLIVISLIDFTLETIPGLPPALEEALTVMEFIVVVVFSAEYLLRLVLAEKWYRFAFSFEGIVDLLAVLPFYLAIGVDLRTLRVLRLFRLLRLFKILRYGRTLRRIGGVWQEIRTEIVFFGMLTTVLLYLSAVGIYYCEREAQPDALGSIPDCLWWAVATLTTVGYGDVYPITVGGKLFTSFVVLLSLGLVAIPGGLIASAFSSVMERERKLQGPSAGS